MTHRQVPRMLHPLLATTRACFEALRPRAREVFVGLGAPSGALIWRLEGRIICSTLSFVPPLAAMRMNGAPVGPDLRVVSRSEAERSLFRRHHDRRRAKRRSTVTRLLSRNLPDIFRECYVSGVILGLRETAAFVMN
jgi:hypothetical protein